MNPKHSQQQLKLRMELHQAIFGLLQDPHAAFGHGNKKQQDHSGHHAISIANARHSRIPHGHGQAAVGGATIDPDHRGSTKRKPPLFACYVLWTPRDINTGLDPLDAHRKSVCPCLRSPHSFIQAYGSYNLSDGHSLHGGNTSWRRLNERGLWESSSLRWQRRLALQQTARRLENVLIISRCLNICMFS